MSIPIADDFAAIAAKMREDTPASYEQYAGMKFSPMLPAFAVGARSKWLADASDAYEEFRLVQGMLGHDDAGLEKAAAGDIEAFTTLAEALADRTKSLMALAWVAELAQLRLVCVLSRLEERQ
jgi:hypothetical protein